ncbi:MAG TPA: hypothetical protein VMW38_11555, partial [Terriglobia bacterium]|nr:hypothetical protein [Terriglobia bacterium]
MIVKVTALEVPPPGAGVNTVMVAVPVCGSSVGVRVAVNLAEVTNFVVKSLLFQRITDPLVKLLPLTVKVILVLPAAPESGEILEIV